MENEPRVLSDEEFGKISAKRLETDRAYMRDVHFTISESRSIAGSKIPGSMIKVEIHSDTGKYRGVTCVEGFRTVDDKHIYFFEEGWPCYEDDFLNPQDIIPSGFFTLNTSTENRERVLEILREENATMEVVRVSKDKMNEILNGPKMSPEEMRKKVEEMAVQVPIVDMKWLDLAIYNCDRHVMQLLGLNPIMFNKELKRTNTRVVERFNHKTKCWEVVPGSPKLGLLEMARMVLS